MKDIFTRTIDVVPGASVQGGSKEDAIDVDESTIPGGQEQLLTSALEYQIHAREGTGAGGVLQLRPSDAEEIARLMEERIIHSYYRLLSRTVRLLSLSPHLRPAHNMAELPEVKWGLLHGISLLNRSKRETDKSVWRPCSTILLLLLVPKPNRWHLQRTKSLANDFAEQSYHFFSLGARFSYLGFRSACGAVSDAGEYLSQRCTRDRICEVPQTGSPICTSNRLPNIGTALS